MEIDNSIADYTLEKSVEESKNKTNKKNITVKIFVDENEALLIKGKLNQINDNLKNYPFKKEKSQSEFLREIILKSLLNLDNNFNISQNYHSILEEKINKLEQYIKRNISLEFETTKENLGDDIAKKILKKAKLNVITLDDESEINVKNNNNK